MPRFAFLAAALLLAGCQSTRYEPKGKPGSFGYSSQSISAQHFVVMYEGDPLAKLSQVRDFALLRAAELTREAGGTHFKVISEQNVIKRRLDEEQIPDRALRPDRMERTPVWAGPPPTRTMIVSRDYPVAWLEVETCPAPQRGGPGKAKVFDAAETQALLTKRYQLNQRDGP